MSDSEPRPDETPLPKPLSAHDAAELAGRVAELSNAGLPLAPGLRAAAAELSGGRLAAALERVAASIESGQSLEQALAAERGAIPRRLQALVAAGTRTGKLGEVLEEFVRFRQTTDDIRRSVWLAAAYPAFLLAMLAVLFVLFFGYFLPTILATTGHEVSDLVIPKSNLESFHWISLHIVTIAVGAVTVLATTAVAILTGGRRLRRLVNHIPLWGTLWRYGALAEFAQLLRILVANEVPLPEALRMTADGIRDADVAAGCRQLAVRAERGMKLAEAMNGLPQFGPILGFILGWGESHAALPEALDATVQLCAERVRSRADLLIEIVPPVVIIAVAAHLLFIVDLFRKFFGSLIQTTVATGGPSSDLRLTTPTFLGAASLILLGCVVLLALRLVYRGQKPPADTLQELMRLAGRLLIALGLLGFFLVFDLALGPLLWIAAMVCWGMCVYRLRRSQQAALLNLVALAADRQMPLEPVVRAWAEEQGGVYFTRADGLADALAAGMPLSEAVHRNRKSLPLRTEVAARIGEVNGALGDALHRLEKGRGQLSWLCEGMSVRLIGLAFVTGIACQYLLFTSINLRPAIFGIFRDFHRDLPPLTRGVMEITASPLTILLTGLLLLTALILSVHGIFRGLGWIRFDLPLFGRLGASLDSAVVLRWLSLVAERGQPLEPALAFLSDSFPRHLIRRRLGRAAADLARGRDWADSLQAAKLVQKTDGAILRAAARVGNLPWALSEAASNGERRLIYRLHGLTQILLPLLILAVGGMVMVFVVAWFLPIISLISELARPG